MANSITGAEHVLVEQSQLLQCLLYCGTLAFALHRLQLHADVAIASAARHKITVSLFQGALEFPCA